MILPTDISRQVNLGSIDPSKIKAYGVGSAVVMQTIVRQTMYSHPERAVLQEYLSNALDAHRERARQDPSFDVSTPPKVSIENQNTLVIEDHGTGISVKRMNENFASYFSSTKRDTNDEIGGYGLGCKTAFADPNRDCFTVDTVYNDEETGVRFFYRTYHFIDNNGLTAFAELEHRQAQPDEDLGTKIILPIDEDDADTYSGLLKKLCFYWPIKPEVAGILDFRWDTYEPMLEGEGWSYSPTMNRVDVVVEGIPYEVRRDLLPDDLIKTRSGLTLFFKTGDIQIVSTRESIDYRGDTILKIKSVVEKAVVEVKKLVSQQLDTIGLFDLKDTVGSFKLTDQTYSWIAEKDVRLDVKMIRYTRIGQTVSCSKTNAIAIERSSRILLGGTTSATTASQGRALSYLDQNPDIDTIYVAPIAVFDGMTNEAAVRALRLPSKFVEMVPENFDFRSYGVHKIYKSLVVRRKCHKFLYKFTSASASGQTRRAGWRKLDSDEEVPEFAIYAVVPKGRSVFLWSNPFTGVDWKGVEPKFLIPFTQRKFIPKNWVNLKTIALGKAEKEYAVACRVPFNGRVIRINDLNPLYISEKRDNETTVKTKLEYRKRFQKTIQDILSFGDAVGPMAVSSCHYVHPEGDLEALTIRDSDVLAKVISRYQFDHKYLRKVLTEIRSVRREDLKSHRKNLDIKLSSTINNFKQHP